MTISSRTSEKGGALLTVLWVSAALAAIAFSVSMSIRAETDRAGTAADGLRAMYLATGSVDRGVQWLLWGTGAGNFFDRHYYSEKPRLNFSYPTGDVVVEMTPEAAKLDINRASGDDLLRLVTVVTGDSTRAREITNGILGWRGGAPAAPDLLSQTLGPTFQSRSASFEEIEELLLVRGMTPELYYGNYVAEGNGRLSPRGGLRDSLSVWGSQGPFDANAVSPALLQALGASPGAIAQLVQRRAQQPFRNLGEVAALGIPIDHLEVNGEHLIWNIRATARLRRPDGSPSEVVRSASAVATLVLPPKNRRRDPIRLKVLRFYEDAWSEFAAAPPAPAAGALLP
ncbi:MAG: general secretion pathway protein GspK [Acidobacteriia bacterium]|nr:general secretion pathway protein GspK [Terriglobia bacterium]